MRLAFKVRVDAALKLVAHARQGHKLPASPLVYRVDDELKNLPSNWKASRRDQAWQIEKIVIPAGEWPNQDYWLSYSADLSLFVMTCGNVDMGVGSLDQRLQTARILDLVDVRSYGLSRCMLHVIEHTKPNEWGYT
jgi:hypothetical protein